MAERLPADLDGVPETLLWTLYHRAVEARRRDAVLDDPRAVELVERLDYPFEERFGRGELGQWQALRVACFEPRDPAFPDRESRRDGRRARGRARDAVLARRRRARPLDRG
jgi:O-methyltransferase involved in polyketide biosynthesis